VSNPPNFAQAVDLSSLGKPKNVATGPTPGVAVTAENLTTEFLPLSKTRAVILFCWSPRSAESIEMLAVMGGLETSYKGSWSLGHVDIDAQPQVAQALQTQKIPYAVALINEQIVPLFEQAYPEAQIRLVLDKVLTLAAEQGVGDTPVEIIEPEEEEAVAALEAGDFATAEIAYKKLLARKPTDSFAKLGLAQTQLLIRTDGLVLDAVIKEATDNPSDLSLQLRAADMEIVNGGVEAAFTRLLHAVKESAGDERNRAKEHLLSLFALVDPADPRLTAARSALANALF
jgi:putative thioredoxin